jgi:hypothetical protein
VAESTSLKALLDQYGAGDGGFDHVPAGPYNVKVASAKAKNNGVFMVLEVVDGPYVGKRIGTGIYPGKTENGIRSFFSKMFKWGLTAEVWFNQDPSIDATAAALKDRVAQVQVEDDTYNGEVRSQVGFGVKLASAPPLPPAQAGVPSVVPQAAAPPAAAPPAAAAVAAPASVAAAPPLAAVPAPAPVAAAPALVAAAPVAAAPAPVPVAAGITVDQEPGF